MDLIFKNNENISLAVFLSKLPVGSSAKIKSGSVIRALATATLCCSPPDNSLGKWLSLLDKFTKDKTFVAFFFDSLHEYPLLTNGIITFSRAVKSLSKLFCWYIIEIPFYLTKSLS